MNINLRKCLHLFLTQMVLKIIPRKLHGLAQKSFAIQQNIFLKVIYEDSLWHQNMFANTGKGNWSFIFVKMLAKLVHMG